jgi:hypothetical protein
VSYIIRGTRDLSWLAAKTNGGYTPRAKGIEAVDEATGKICGMLGYDNFTYNSAQISIAIEKPACIRRLWRPALDYPFKELNKAVVIGLISSANIQSFTFAGTFGFQVNTQIDDAILPGVHLIIVELRKEWWLRRLKDGLPRRRHTQPAGQGCGLSRLHGCSG